MKETTRLNQIKELIHRIQTRDIVLPAFQRGYAWSKEQAKELTMSLVKGYPVGNLIFWTTDSPPALKNLPSITESLQDLILIIDGEQILTALFMLIAGEIPPYYTEQDINTDPRSLYYNLGTGDFQYYQSSLADDRLWWKVVDCFSQRDTVTELFEIAKQQAKDDEDAFQLVEHYNENLYRLRHVLDVPLPALVIHASFDEAFEIFQRFTPELQRGPTVEDLIGIGESVTLEFKSTLQWDVVKNCVDKGLRLSVLKTIAAFLNSEGGTLLIGVEDNGYVCGLEDDLKATGGSLDRFEQLLTSLVSDRIGPEYGHFIKIDFETVEGKTVCVMDVNRAQTPVLLKGPSGKQFYVRVGNTTRVLDFEEALRYVVQTDWE